MEPVVPMVWTMGLIVEHLDLLLFVTKGLVVELLALLLFVIKDTLSIHSNNHHFLKLEVHYI